MQKSVELNFNNQLYYGDNFSRQQSKPWKIIEALARATMAGVKRRKRRVRRILII